MAPPSSLQRCLWPCLLYLLLLHRRRRRQKDCSRPHHTPRASFILVLTFQHKQCPPPRMLQNFRLLWKMTHLHHSPYLPHRTTDSRGSFQLSVPKNSRERRKRRNSQTVNTRISLMEFGTVQIVVAQKISPLVVARARLATNLSVALVVRNPG